MCLGMAFICHSPEKAYGNREYDETFNKQNEMEKTKGMIDQT